MVITLHTSVGDLEYGRDESERWRPVGIDPPDMLRELASMITTSMSLHQDQFSPGGGSIVLQFADWMAANQLGWSVSVEELPEPADRVY